MADDPTLKAMVVDSLAWAETGADPQQAPPWMADLPADDQVMVTREVHGLIDTVRAGITRAYGGG